MLFSSQYSRVTLNASKQHNTHTRADELKYKSRLNGEQRPLQLQRRITASTSKPVGHSDASPRLPATLSHAAAGLMHTFNAHAATDITGFGILGHAQTLAKQQRSEVSFVIHNLPVLAKMAAVSKACGNMFGLMHGTCPETSGVYVVCYFLDMRFLGQRTLRCLQKIFLQCLL